MIEAFTDAAIAAELAAATSINMNNEQEDLFITRNQAEEQEVDAA